MDGSEGYFYRQLFNLFARKRKRARKEEEDEDKNEDSEDVDVVVASIQATIQVTATNNSMKKASTHAELIIFRNSDMLFPSAILIYGT